MMRVIVAAVAGACLSTASAFAAAPKIEAAIKVFSAVAADTGKLRTFCAMMKVMDQAGDKPNAAADAKIDGYMKQLGADFETAWSAVEGLNESSADGKAYHKALDDLSGKCS